MFDMLQFLYQSSFTGLDPKIYQQFKNEGNYFKGTNHGDALAISVKTIKGLQKFNTSTFFISTHIAELKNEMTSSPIAVDAYYIDCQIQDELPVFSYIVKTGWSNLQIGQLLFKKEGLDDLLGQPSSI